MVHSECQEVFYDENGFIPNIEFGSMIVVSSLPVVEAEMAQELESEIRVVFSEVGVIKEDGFSMPVNPTTQETLGHCFIEFNSQEVVAFVPLLCFSFSCFLGLVSVILMQQICWVFSLWNLVSLEFDNPVVKDSQGY